VGWVESSREEGGNKSCIHRKRDDTMKEIKLNETSVPKKKWGNKKESRGMH
jgi:hypothetical protein